MKLTAILTTALLSGGLVLSPTLAPADEVLSAEAAEKPLTAGGHAWADMRRAAVRDGILHLEVQFLTDYVGYSGEKIYEDIPADRLGGFNRSSQHLRSYPV